MKSIIKQENLAWLNAKLIQPQRQAGNSTSNLVCFINSSSMEAVHNTYQNSSEINTYDVSYFSMHYTKISGIARHWLYRYDTISKNDNAIFTFFNTCIEK